MCIPVSFSPEDLKRGQVFEPDWYRVHINSIEAATSKDGGSTNYLVKGVVLKNASNGNEKYKDYPTPYWNFNSKAMGFTQGFFRALGVEIEAGVRYDLEAMSGKDIDVMIENDTYNGALVNRINHKYRAPKD